MPPRSTARADLARLLERAHAAHVAGALAKADKLYKDALKHDPDNFDLLHVLGILHQQRGRPTEALTYLAAALRRNGTSAQALSDHGFVLHELGRFAEAAVSYRAALAIDPGKADVLNRLCIALIRSGRPGEALVSLDHALAKDPAFGDALGNRGNALLKLNRPDEAIACYDAARRIDGDSARLRTNRGHALRRLDRLDEALADLRQAVALDPAHAEAEFELSLVLLALGDFADGWAAYERRWATAAFVPHRRDFSSPLWTGRQPVDGRTLLLHGEQGLGDTIQFVRYVAEVARRGATILLEVQPELAALIAGAGLPARVIARGHKLAAFDLHCPLMSLPRALATRVEDIPAEVPYLKAAADKTASWARRLPPGRRVGLAFAGRPTHDNDEIGRAHV
jgi:tetratricopeptide (TPR) repeat protein